MTTLTDDHRTLLEEIERLLDASGEGADPPALTRIEDALTTGYAHALALEAERLRLETRMKAIAADLAAGVGSDPGTLAALAHEASGAESRLTRLRGQLGRLRDRASTLRSALAPDGDRPGV
jgi:hypothetical protein